MEVTVAYESKDILGEGPVWSPEEQALYWIDIDFPSVQRWKPETGEFRRWMMRSAIGSFAFCEDGRMVVALRDGLFFFDPESHEFEKISDPEEDKPDNRFNDGKVDRQGRFWAGTLHNEEVEARGSLYLMNHNLEVTTMRENNIISNGIGWSPDNQTIYFTDSGTQTIYAYDFEPETGKMSHERIFARDTDCFPDGLTVDAEGYVWSAKWDGWKVVRYTPDGQIDQEIRLPVQRPTSVMFGGPDLSQLYITSASVRLTEEELALQPLAGHLFVLQTGTRGLPETKFGKKPE